MAGIVVSLAPEKPLASWPKHGSKESNKPKAATPNQ